METLPHISLELQRNGYSVIPWQINDNRHTVPDIFQCRVDGVISASAYFNFALYEECATFHIVQFAGVESGSDCSLIITQHESDLSHKAFCQSRNIGLSTFNAWKHKPEKKANSLLDQLQPEASPDWIELPPDTQETTASTSWHIELELPGGVALRMRR